MTGPIVCIMHAAFQPSRKASLRTLTARLHGLQHTVVEDYNGVGPWPVARRCWKHGLLFDVSHVVVMNDDALPCPDFADVLHDAIEGRPNDILCFYSNDERDRGISQTHHWRSSTDGAAGVACCMPAHVVCEFLEWHDGAFRGEFTDDGRVDLFAMATGRKIYTTLPSLVDHQLPDESTVGTVNDGRRRAVVPPRERMRGLRWDGPAVDIGRVHGSHWRLLHNTRPETWPKYDTVRKAYAIARTA